MAEMTIEQQRAIAMAKARAAASAQNSGKEYTGQILPFSVDAAGGRHFDSDAGILGAIKRSFMLPGDVYTGKEQVMGANGEVRPEMLGRSLEFASTFSPTTPGLRAGEGLIPGEKKMLRSADIEPPTAEQLYDEAGRNFSAMRESGVDYSSDAVKDMALAAKSKLEEQGFDPEVAGKTHRILDKLANPPEGSVANIKGLHSARKTFGKIAQNFNDPTDQSAASQAIRGLDEFIGADNPASVVAGTASDAATALKAGNANYAAGKRSDLLTGIDRAADLRAGASNSGANIGNSIRQRVASALLNEKAIAGFSPEEIASLEKIDKGTFAQNATRRIGNLLGGGGGMGQMLTTAIGGATGAATGGAPGAAVGTIAPLAIGTGSKELSNILTDRALDAADKMVRSRSPLYQALQEAAPKEAVRQAPLEALIRALTIGSAVRPGTGGGGW